MKLCRRRLFGVLEFLDFESAALARQIYNGFQGWGLPGLYIHPPPLTFPSKRPLERGAVLLWSVLKTYLSRYRPKRVLSAGTALVWALLCLDLWKYLVHVCRTVEADGRYAQQSLSTSTTLEPPITIGLSIFHPSSGFGIKAEGSEKPGKSQLCLRYLISVLALQLWTGQTASCRAHFLAVLQKTGTC